MKAFGRTLSVVLLLLIFIAACKPQQSPTEPAKTLPAEVQEVSTEEVEEDAAEEATLAPEETAEEAEETAPEEVLMVNIPLIPNCEAGSWVSPVDGAKLICVPAGEYPMGAMPDDSAAEADEKPLHNQQVENFWIYESEVSNRMFRLFVEATGYVSTAEVNGFSNTYQADAWQQLTNVDWQHPWGVDSDLTGLDEQPVVNVSKADAAAYCLWANNGFLPSETQWEKAARGTEQRLYPWGSQLPAADLAVFGAEAYSAAAEVLAAGQVQGNSPYGMYHMAGNAAEWVSNPYNENSYSNGDFFTNDGQFNVARGGGWLSEENELRVSDRQPVPEAVESADFIGFRCVVPEHAENPAAANSETPVDTNCELNIPAGYQAVVLAGDTVSTLNTYGDVVSTVNTQSSSTVRQYWEEEAFGLGFLIPGSVDFAYKYIRTPCGMIMMDLALIQHGQADWHNSVSITSTLGLSVVTAQDGSVVVMVGQGGAVVQNDDGSLTVTLPNSECAGSQSGSSQSKEPVELSGGGVSSLDLVENADGTIKLTFHLADGEYPEGFDAWNQKILDAMPPISSYSSSYSESNGTVTDAWFEISIPAGSEALLDGDVLTVVIQP